MLYVKPTAEVITMKDDILLCLSIDVEDINGWTVEDEWK